MAVGAMVLVESKEEEEKRAATPTPPFYFGKCLIQRQMSQYNIKGHQTSFPFPKQVMSIHCYYYKDLISCIVYVTLVS